MSGINIGRRGLLAGGAFAGLAIGRPAKAQSAPMSLDEALKLRRSTRAFRTDPLDDAMLLALAWAAQGINRPETGLRTAPSWHGAADTVLHVADASGVRLYDPPSHALKPVLSSDIRGKVSPQPFVATAPVCLVYTADIAMMPTDDQEAKQRMAPLDAAIVAQNVYLFCASRGLGTCLVGGIDAPAIASALDLPATAFATFVQPVGWPA